MDIWENQKKRDEEDKYISKHFDFRLNGDIDGVDRQDELKVIDHNSRDFGYAYFRDELKAQDNLQSRYYY